jgi:hypothetical protein
MEGHILSKGNCWFVLRKESCTGQVSLQQKEVGERVSNSEGLPISEIFQALVCSP